VCSVCESSRVLFRCLWPSDDTDKRRRSEKGGERRKRKRMLITHSLHSIGENEPLFTRCGEEIVGAAKHSRRARSRAGADRDDPPPPLEIRCNNSSKRASSLSSICSLDSFFFSCGAARCSRMSLCSAIAGFRVADLDRVLEFQRAVLGPVRVHECM